MDSKTSSTPSPPPRYNEVVCVGAGLSALSLGSQLQIQYNLTDFHIYEKNEGIGGTWWANTYPGAACDIPSALYSFSFAPNPDWSSSLPPQGEIKAYIDSVASKYGILERTSLSTAVTRAQWDEGRDRWRLSLRDVKTGEAYSHECKILFTGQGMLEKPHYPKIPGLETFEGHIFHSACWDHTVDLKSKRVAIIGGGCSAAQIVPAIAPEVEVVKQFIRTPHWVLEWNPIEYTAFNRWIYRNVPLAYRFHRLLVFALLEWDFRLFPLSRFAQGQRDRVREHCVKYLQDKTPERYHKLLLPDHQVACKRRIVDDGYLTSLNRSNVQVYKERAIEITPRGIEASDEIHHVDVIVLATGFQRSGKFFKDMEVLGRNGVSADKHWDGIGGIGAYNTTAMHDFPNFFMLLGPNSVTGHSSAIFAIENAVNYALRVLKPVLRGDASRVEVKERSEKEYINRVQAKLRETVWNTGCSNWYTSNGWNATAYPWSQLHYYYRSVFVKDKDWDVTVSLPS
ncbi:putative monooxygenase [Tuber magnatum]|uniref:Putative monooxygenase n=1 Tax=Tuber magnatum TaxID=42249 RepID=A0A317SNB2_9PEZI|nr:putative monooxygenase [Tuber magnatum]